MIASFSGKMQVSAAHSAAISDHRVVLTAYLTWQGDSFRADSDCDENRGKVRKKGKFGTYAMKRVAAGAHLPTLRLFQPAKRSDDRADYCLDCSFLLVQSPCTRFYTRVGNG